MQIDIGNDRFTHAILGSWGSADARHLPILASKLQEFRRKKISETGSYTGWNLAQEMKRSRESYLRELTDETVIICICTRTQRIEAQQPGVGSEEALVQGEWIGMARIQGPQSLGEWSIPSTKRPLSQPGPELLFSAGGTHILPEFRGLRDGEGRLLVTTMLMTFHAYLAKRVQRMATHFPTYIRARATITPQFLTDGHMVEFYRRHLGYQLVGLVPEAIHWAVNNRILPLEWPEIQQYPGFYTKCNFGALEQVMMVTADDFRVLVADQPEQRL